MKEILNLSSTTNTTFERPSTSNDGMIVAYEAVQSSGIKHVYYKNLKQESSDQLV